MKRTYTKPLIAMESFQLNAAIAAACSQREGGIAIHYGENSCLASEEMPGLDYFGIACQEAGGKDVVSGGPDGNDGICYHGFIAGIVFLAS